ncbi:unnamed protein product [Closterium sp. NIES-53]
MGPAYFNPRMVFASMAPVVFCFLPVARPGRVAVSAHCAPPADDGVMPVARPQRETVFCPSRGGPAALLPVVPDTHFLLPLLLRVQQFGRGEGGGGGCWGDAGVVLGGVAPPAPRCSASSPSQQPPPHSSPSPCCPCSSGGRVWGWRVWRMTGSCPSRTLLSLERLLHRPPSPPFSSTPLLRV